jgi:hypothetical protein
MVHALALSVVLQLANAAHVPSMTLREAQRELFRVYRAIGVDVSWSLPDSSRDPFTIRVIVIEYETGELQHRPKTVMGAAVHTAEGMGVAYIFYRRVESQANQYAVTIGSVLACAMAHELGHLLLPNGFRDGHSTIGLMRASWDRDDFQRADRGQLRFEPEQAALIRSSLKGWGD